PFLEDWVFAVPKRKCKTEPLPIVGDAGQTVFSPAIGTGARFVVSEVVPGIAVFTVILPHSSPLPLAPIWAPLLPGDALLTGFCQMSLFGIHHAPRARAQLFFVRQYVVC